MLKTLTFCFLFICSSINFANDSLLDHLDKEEIVDLDQIIKNKYIRVLTTKDSFAFYIHNGKSKGYQYEMVSRFVSYLNKKYTKKSKLKIQFELIPVDHDELIPMLLKGRGDIIATNFSITEQRKKLISFSKPYLKTKELLVSRIDQEDINEVYIRESSSYYSTLKKLSYDIKFIPDSLDTLSVLELISFGKYPATVADEEFYEIAKGLFPVTNLKKVKVLNKSRPIAWATRPSSVKLLNEINHFIPHIKKGSFFGNLLKKRYFKDIDRIKESLKETDSISPYDHYIKKYAKKYKWDWRLLASLCFQESRFVASRHNRYGAIGLFQIKQKTAEEPYINIPNIKGKKNIENNIHAGIKYLSWIRNRYFTKKSIDDDDRARLTIAAYNSGPRRVLKAISLAKKLKLNPNKWFRNVELAMVKMRKIEPVNYVSQINKRFVSYKLLGH